MNIDLYDQVRELITAYADFSKTDLYYIGFSSYFIQALTLEKLFKHIQSLNQACQQDLMTGSERMDLLIDILYNALKDRREIVIIKEGSTIKETLNEYFSQIQEVISNFESTSKLEAFYTGRFHALLPSYKITKLFHYIKKLNEVQSKGSLSETKKKELLIKLFNSKLKNKVDGDENILDLPDENSNMLNSVHSRISGNSFSSDFLNEENISPIKIPLEAAPQDTAMEEESSKSSPQPENRYPSYQRAVPSSNILSILNKYLPAKAAPNLLNKISLENDDKYRSPVIINSSQEVDRTASIQTQQLEEGDHHYQPAPFNDFIEEEVKDDENLIKSAKESDKMIKSMYSIDKFFKPKPNGHFIELEEVEMTKELEYSRQSINPNSQHLCVICKESTQDQGKSVLQNCSCQFHTRCLSKYAMTYLKNDIDEIKCPKPKCPNRILLFDLIDIVDDSALEKYTELRINRYFERNKSFICCPTAGCPFAFLATYQSKFSCPLCRNNYCLSCLQSWHPEDFCEFEGNARRMRLKICSCCGEWIEVKKDSDILECKQGFVFCWKCGQEEVCGQDHKEHSARIIVPPELFHQIFKTPENVRLLKVEEEESKKTAIISLEENGHSMGEELDESVHTQIIESEYSEELNLNLDDGSFRNISLIKDDNEEEEKVIENQPAQAPAPRSQRSQEMTKAVNQKTRMLLVVVILNLLIMAFFLKNRRG